MIKQSLLDQLPDRISFQRPSISPELQQQQGIALILAAIKEELARLNRQTADRSELETLRDSIAAVEDTVNRLDTDSLEARLQEISSKLPTEIPAPQVNIGAPVVNVPELDLSSLLEAIRAIKLDFNGDVKVTNQQDVVKALNDLKPLLAQISMSVEDKTVADEVRVTNLNELKVTSEFPKEVLDLLKHLKNLNTTADRPLSVRLSDGSKYYVAVAKAIERGVQAVAMGTTPSFKDSSGVPQRALVDGNGALKTSPDAYTVKLEYSGNNPIYVGKAVPGSAVGSAVWQIQKLTYSGSNVTDVQWANGSNGYTAVWDDRASYTYS